MHKKIVAGVLAIMLSGCSIWGDEYSVEIKKEEQETEYSSVYAEIIEFGGFKDKKYQSELNLSIGKDVLNAISEFDALALEARQNMPAGVKSVLNITQKIKRNSSGIISFVTENYIYAGGAHGNTSWYARTIDAESEKPHDLKLDELFTTDDYKEKLNRIITQMVKENPDKYSELWEKPEITNENENRFYMTDTDLVIFFPPYELSYYAKGFIEFPIPLEEINAMLKEEYQNKYS